MLETWMYCVVANDRVEEQRVVFLEQEDGLVDL